MSSTSPVQIYSEFQNLEEVIVGRAYPAEAFDFHQDLELREGLSRILSETEEDILTLVALLEKRGIKVRRPEMLLSLSEEGKPRKFKLGRFDFTFPNHPLMPRDTTLVAGQDLIQTYTKSHGRYLENWAYYDLFKEYFEQGARWLSMPPPFLEGNPADYRGVEDKKLYFHAANFLKCGRDIFYSQPTGPYWNGKGTASGLDWFRSVLGDRFRLHPAPCAGHLDGKIALIKPGLLVTWDKSFIPEALKSWDAIVVQGKSPFPETFKKIKKQRFYGDFVKQWLAEWIGYVDETVFDVNMFSLSESAVVTNGVNVDVFRELEKHGVEPIPWTFRHQFFWDGAIHCLTLDIRRSGPQEDYFS